MKRRGTAQRKYPLTGTIGLPGAGKTTVAVLQQKLGFLFLGEPYPSNPFLERFYQSGMKEWAYPSQKFFLAKAWRLADVAEYATEHFPVVVDPDIRLHIYMYATALRKMGSISPEEWALYQGDVELLMGSFPEVPDLLIYCQISLETLLSRIEERGRKMEEHITPEYLELLEECLGEWLAGYSGPVLPLDMDKLDITTEEGAAAALREVERVLEVNRFVI